MAVKVVESEPKNPDGFAWYWFEEGNEPLGSIYASVVKQKGFDGTTLRVRDIQINPSNEAPPERVAKVFAALFKWNKADNMKFYIDSNNLLFLFTLFGSDLQEQGLIQSMETHSSWVIYKGVK